MLKTFWRRSFKGRCIKSVPMPSYPVKIYENKDLRWVSFGSSYIQTAIKKQAPWQPVLHYIHPMCITQQYLNPKANILLLGMGCGGIIHYLRHPQPQQHITAIELESQIIDIAQSYFQIVADSHLNIIQQDASYFVQHTQQQYDLVLVDLFNNQTLPGFLQQRFFYNNCYKIMSAHAILSLNILYQDQKQLMEIVHSVRTVFNGQTLGLMNKKSTNFVLLASKDHNMLDILEQLQQQAKVTDVQWQQQIGLTAVVCEV